MSTLEGINRIFKCETNINQTPPFTTTLPDNGTVTLCSLNVPTCRNAYLVRAVINWSVEFRPFLSLIILSTPGFAQVQFEILRDGGPIARVTQSLGQLGYTIGDIFNTEAANFGIATLQVLDTSSLAFNISNQISTFEVRATNVILTAPLSVNGTTIIPLGDITSAVGAVSLIVEEVESRRMETESC